MALKPGIKMAKDIELMDQLLNWLMEVKNGGGMMKNYLSYSLWLK
jgi:hypothetical protein